MTIMRGISHDGDQQVPEVTNDVMLAAPAKKQILDFARQKSFTNLPDFTYLLESLNTPTLKVGFDFASAPSDELAYSEGLSTEYSESLSLYPESQDTFDLKKVKVEPKVEPLSDVEDQRSQSASPQVEEAMGLDYEVEHSQMSMVGSICQVKGDCREDERTANSTEQTVHELSKKMDKCCAQLRIPRDPTQWSAGDVQRWVSWTLHESYTGCAWSVAQLNNLQVDGTTLCMLQQRDFVTRVGEELGELLFIEIDLWKNAYCIEIQNIMDSQPPQTVATQADDHLFSNRSYMPTGQLYPEQEPPTYVDISDSRPTVCAVSSIPTPQYEMSPITLSQLNQLPPTTTAATGHLPSVYPSQQSCHQMSPASLGSMGYGGEMSDSNHSDECMDDNLSRASTPSEPMYPHSMVQQPSPVPQATRTTPAKRYGGNVGHTKHTIHLWQFLRELLLQPNHFNNCIRWVDQRKGIFKIEDSARVARLWGQRKNRPAMNYDKLSRSIRQYYKKGIIKKTEQSKRLVYQFCEAYL